MNDKIKTGRNRDLFNLFILLAVTLSIGVYLIVTTVVIAKDGVTFIEYARQLDAGNDAIIKDHYQHPGYPFLIFAVHKIFAIFSQSDSNLAWAYCAQSVSLLFRLLAVVVIYYIGSRIVGPNKSFWSVLVLICLPSLAEYGSDALSDWPHLFFLALGLLLLIRFSNIWWQFGFIGLVAGLGYLIRPECAQLVIFACAWLGIRFFMSEPVGTRLKVVASFAVLCIGFGLIATPYMLSKGALLPKKKLNFSSSSFQENATQPPQQTVMLAGFDFSQLPARKMGGAVCKFIENLGETYMWFFVLPLILGIFVVIRQQKGIDPEKFFICSLIIFNILILTWLYCRHGYMSRRHTMPLYAVLSVYLYSGIEIVEAWIKRKFSGTRISYVHNGRFWLYITVATGILICTPKLLRPVGYDKQGFRTVADWIKNNTQDSDLIAVPDKRIGFYSRRAYVFYDDCDVELPGSDYIVLMTQSNKVENDNLNLRVDTLYSIDMGEKQLSVISPKTH